MLSFHSLYPVNVACLFQGGQTSLHCADTDTTSLRQGVLRWATEATLRVHEVIQQVGEMVTGSGEGVISTHGSDPSVAIGWLTLSAEVIVRGGLCRVGVLELIKNETLLMKGRMLGFRYQVQTKNIFT